MQLFFASEATGGLGSLGINTGALLFQLINFAILYWILQRYVFPAILRLLNSRRERIEKSLADAEAATAARAEAETERDELLREAREQAKAIVATAREEAKVDASKILDDARATARAAGEQSQAKLAADVAAARRQLMEEMREVVAVATAEVTRGELRPPEDSAIISKALKEKRA